MTALFKMSFSYDSFLKRQLSCFSFKRDSFWSWLLVGVAFINKMLNIGVMFALGSFFDSWRNEFGDTRGKVSNDIGIVAVDDLGANFSQYSRRFDEWINTSRDHFNNDHTGLNHQLHPSTSQQQHNYALSDASLTWIQSCAFSLCYMSSPLANATLRLLPPRIVLIAVGIILCLCFFVAAEIGE